MVSGIQMVESEKFYSGNNQKTALNHYKSQFCYYSKKERTLTLNFIIDEKCYQGRVFISFFDQSILVELIIGDFIEFGQKRW